MDNILFPNLDLENDLMENNLVHSQTDQFLQNLVKGNKAEGNNQDTRPSSSQTPKYKCEFCDYKTEKKSNHDSHVKFVHLKAKESCPECGKKVSNLNQHLRVSHKIFKSNTTQKKCPECGKMFHNVEGHLLKAHNIRPPSEYLCEICCKTFSKKNHLARHESAVHMGVRENCQFCNKDFSNLSAHIKSKHCQSRVEPQESLNTSSYYNTEQKSDKPQSTKRFCNLCNNIFANLEQHIKIVHKKVKNYSCQKCQKGFYDNRELRRHHIRYLKTGVCKKEVQSELCKYQCKFSECNYKTNKKNNLNIHISSVHLNIKFNCPECGKQLSSRANLNSHVKNVHNKKLVKGCVDPLSSGQIKIDCKLCDYSTTRSTHLDRHMLSVHSAAAFETVEQVYQASTQQDRLVQHNNSGLPQFSNLARLEAEIEDTVTQHLHADTSSLLSTPGLHLDSTGRLVLPEDTALLTSSIVLPLDNANFYFM